MRLLLSLLLLLLLLLLSLSVVVVVVVYYYFYYYENCLIRFVPECTLECCCDVEQRAKKNNIMYV